VESKTFKVDPTFMQSRFPTVQRTHSSVLQKGRSRSTNADSILSLFPAHRFFFFLHRGINRVILNGVSNSGLNATESHESLVC